MSRAHRRDFAGVETLVGKGEDRMAWLRRKPETRTSASWHNRATAVIAGPLAPLERSPQPPTAERFFAAGQGPWVEDVDGNRYIDLTGGGGAMILGYGAPRVVEALRQTAAQAIGLGTTASHTVLLAEQLRQRIAPIDKVRFTPSHTTATALALRIARAHSGRSAAVVFEGAFHGDVPELLAAQCDAREGRPGTPGRPSPPQSQGASAHTGPIPIVAAATRPAPVLTPVAAAATRPLTLAPAVPAPDGDAPELGDVIVVPYGDLARLSEVFESRGSEIACLLTEAAPMHMGTIAPPLGFNSQLATLCRHHEALFISDETVTGFRASASGVHGLEGAKENWAPDLLIMGGVIGGGLPIGAVGGGAALMDLIGGEVPLTSETCSPLACAAGLATLAGLDAELYLHLATTAAALQELIGQELDAAGVAHHIQAAGGGFSVFFGDGPVMCLADAQTRALGRYRVFANALLDGGVRVPSSPFGAWFVSGAHDETALEHIAAALPAAARAVAKAANL